MQASSEGWQQWSGRARTRLAIALLGALGIALPAWALTQLNFRVEKGSLSASAVGDGALQGRFGIVLSDLPPLDCSVRFELVDLALSGPNGLRIGLDPSLDLPGLGLLRPDGSWLIPTLFLRLDDGAAPIDVALTDLAGTLSRSRSRAARLRLDTHFGLDAGDPLGGVEGALTATAAVPEPATWVSLALGCAGLVLLSHRDRVRA